MASSNLRQLRLLLWKNFLLQKRRPISTIFELGLPLLFILILLLLRIFKIHQSDVQAKDWRSFPYGNFSWQIPLHLPKGHNKSAKWNIAYAPKVNITEKVMNDTATRLGVGTQGFNKESEMVRVLVNDEEKDPSNWKYIGGVFFKRTPNFHNVVYKIRLSSSTRNKTKESKIAAFAQGQSWHTKSVFPRTFQGIGPRSNNSIFGGPPDYYIEGFLSIQYAVDMGVMAFKSRKANFTNFNLRMQRFPYPAYIRDVFVIVIQNTLPLLLMLSLVYTALVIVRSIVYEKEKRLKESMKIMGLSGWLHWLAWFIKCFLTLLIPMSVITCFLCVKFGGNGRMLMNSDPFLIFVFLLIYSASSIMFCFCLSTFFYRSNIAAAAGGILWFLSYIPYFFLANYYNTLSLSQKLASCLDFQVGMAFGASLIGKFEGVGIGVQWSNLFTGVTVDDSFTFGSVLLMMIADCFIYGIIMWYVEAIYPGEFGIPQPWYFPFKKSYWCGTKRQELSFQESNLTMPLIGSSDYDNASVDSSLNSEMIEKDPEEIRAGIQIKRLAKEFETDSGTKVAVNSISLNMYEGQITALLGHNGAGKTTTISMLTGLFPPTSGTAIINGFNILQDLPGVRRSLGICPQHNVLFEKLTVEEHLWFFAQLKGMPPGKNVNAEVDRMISTVGLEDKKKTQTRNLSGGMKRKLSVGIALIADSKVVMLDEPTSGMDPSARRFTWDLLQREREGRTILLTTHFMDEADLLGDRIAIMADGVIKCCGASLFLKKKYGVGYHLVMVKKPECRVTSITQLVQRHVPHADLENDVGLELSYVLPSEFSEKFEGLFTELEENADQLGISSYGASITTLEEVFLKVAKEGTPESEESVSKKIYRQLSSKSDTSVEIDPETGSIRESRETLRSPVLQMVANGHSGSFHRNTGWKLFRQRWYAMFVKRVLNSKRYKASIVSQLVMPGIFTLLALIVAKTFPQPTDSPARTLDTTMFQKNYVPYSIVSGASNKTMIFENLFTSQFANTETNAVNVTGKFNANMSKYILDKSAHDIGRFNTKYLIALSIKADGGTVNSTAWFNNEAFHSPAVSLNAFTNAVLKYYTNRQHSITTINHPLPRTTQQTINDLNKNGVGFNVAFNVLFGMAFLASSFIVFLVQEKASKSKHVQFVSGVSPICYWTSALVWDLINYIFPVILIIILFAAFNVPAYSGERMGYVVLLLMLYGWGVIPVMYLASFLFKVPSSGFIRMTIFNIITGLATLLAVKILSIPQLDLLDLAKALKWAFLVLPNYSLGQGLIDLFNNYQYIDIYNQATALCVDLAKQRHIPITPLVKRKCESGAKAYLANMSTPIVFQTNYLAWDNPGIGRYLVFLSWEGLVVFLLVILIEYKGFLYLLSSGKNKRKSYKQVHLVEGEEYAHMDDDVIEEKRRVTSGEGSDDDVLVMENVTKYYGSLSKRLLAVDHLCLGIPPSECFGLLGLNGAGKTTTFKMITGDETMTEGSIMVDGYDTQTDMNKVRQRIGYCPQFDALVDLMTGKEILTMYARLRGVPEGKIPKTVKDLSHMLTLDNYIDKVSKTYSGGNKRKLSTAISLVGDPPIIFLDEPTTGMDPVARRMLWDALTKYRDEGKSIVITSHSMEECEALCTRLAIMVNGQFKCLGSPQHLKSKFGEGYTLLARIGGSSPDTRPLKVFVEQLFPGSVLKDEHQGYLHYQLKSGNKSWGKVFGIMERAKEDYNMDDYSELYSHIDKNSGEKV